MVKVSPLHPRRGRSLQHGMCQPNVSMPRRPEQARRDVREVLVLKGSIRIAEPVRERPVPSDLVHWTVCVDRIDR